jgi:RNA polymerase primary sigma factor
MNRTKNLKGIFLKSNSSKTSGSEFLRPEADQDKPASERGKIIELPSPGTTPAGRDRPDSASENHERQVYDGDSSFKLYLREICQTKLLTPAEEIQLTLRIRRGDENAREQMIKANLRLVVKIARDYENLGTPLLDLVSEGNVGLMKAVERFDPARGAKFSTYSGWWIKQSIKRALANQSKTIRLPIHVVDKLFRMRQVSARLNEILGREATDEELGEEMKIPAAKIARLRTAAMRPASLEAPVNEGEPNEIAELIKDESAATPYEHLEKKTVAGMVRQLVGTLNARELEILSRRFGLDGEPEKSLEEVGQILGLTRERIRQIQNVALIKLRKDVEKLGMLGAAA